MGLQPPARGQQRSQGTMEGMSGWFSGYMQILGVPWGLSCRRHGGDRRVEAG